MNQEQISKQLQTWLCDFVEANNTALNNWAPCPFARAARLSGLIHTVFATVSELDQVVRENLHMLESKDVVVVCFDHNNIDPVELQEWVSGMNQWLMPRDYVILDDHPHAPEYVNGVRMNFDMCGLLVIQHLSKLNTASEKLKSQGYYDTWDSNALDQVVSWRFKK